MLVTRTHGSQSGERYHLWQQCCIRRRSCLQGNTHTRSWKRKNYPHFKNNPLPKKEKSNLPHAQNSWCKTNRLRAKRTKATLVPTKTNTFLPRIVIDNTLIWFVKPWSISQTRTYCCYSLDTAGGKVTPVIVDKVRNRYYFKWLIPNANHQPIRVLKTWRVGHRPRLYSKTLKYKNNGLKN